MALRPRISEDIHRLRFEKAPSIVDAGGQTARSAVRLLVVVWRAQPGAALGSIEGTAVPLLPCLYPRTQPAGKTSASSNLGIHGELPVVMEPFVEEPLAFRGWARLCTWGAACALSRNPGTWDGVGRREEVSGLMKGMGRGLNSQVFRASAGDGRCSPAGCM